MVGVAPHSWVDVLEKHAADIPLREALLYSSDGEETESTLTYRELDRRARAIAAALLSRVQPGSRALLIHRPGLEFVEALFGCFYAGVVAVPTYPPRMIRGALDKKASRAQLIAQDAEPSLIITDDESIEAVQRTFGERLAAATTAELVNTAAGGVVSKVDGDALALLQYTSGSTSAPKGVMLSQANLLANSAAIYAAFGHSPDLRGTLWLPHEHDMGLVGAILQTIYAGGSTLLLSPLAFLQEPMCWLRAISRHRATTAGGPNFAFQMLAERAAKEELTGLDLSTWEVAFVGAEPVRPETLSAFAIAFQPAGFRSSAFLPCYGLAESTLIVTGAPKGRGMRSVRVTKSSLERGRIELAPLENATARELVSAGVPSSSRVRVVDPESRVVLDEGVVGEVAVTSASVARGYYAKDGDRTFDGSTLYTGDLGFLHEGELYLTGRLKDLIIIDGSNHFAEDLERSIDGCHPELRSGAGVVFSVDAKHGEAVVVVWETRRPKTKDDRASIIRDIRATIAREHNLALSEVVLTVPGRVPRTESGKVRRRECRRAFLARELDTE